MNIIEAQGIIAVTSFTPKAHAVFSYLANRSNQEHYCWPGLKRIAEACNISVSSVQRAIKEMLGLGVLMKKPCYRANGSQTSNIYILTDDLKKAAAVKKENERIQRKIEERRKAQERKIKAAERMKEELEKHIVNLENIKKELLIEDADKNKALNVCMRLKNQIRELTISGQIKYFKKFKIGTYLYKGLYSKIAKNINPELKETIFNKISIYRFLYDTIHCKKNKFK